jgi:UDP-GlcNAc:undecaprenyl-phosphate/decaprenyl-phosphate GlcNAc-1-phosphate transferase
MQLLMILGGVSFLLALILTPVCRNLLQRYGLVDRPDKARKLHPGPVPTMGGVPIFIAYLASFGTLLIGGLRMPLGKVDFSLALRLAPAVAIIFVLGVIDDRFRLQPVQKAIVQMLAAGWACWAGVRITGFAVGSVPYHLSIPMTVAWLIVCTNAFNFIDGVDGLATGVGLSATATTLVAALVQHNVLLATATVPLAGALLGFVRYNFNPATIFLGDSGSLTIGFLLGCFGVIWGQKSATILGMTGPLIALSIPILDLCLTVVRRFLRGQPIMRGDRQHIHHRLLDRGLSPKKVVLLLYALCGVTAVFSLFQSITVNHYSAAVIVVFCGIAWVGIQNLGYAEFDQARRLILAGGFRQALNSQLALRAFDRSLTDAQTMEARWAVLRKALKEFGFVEVYWCTRGEVYHDELWRMNEGTSWMLAIPLGGRDYINFTRVANMDDRSMNVGALVEIIRKNLISSSEETHNEISQLERLSRSLSESVAVRRNDRDSLPQGVHNDETLKAVVNGPAVPRERRT